MSFPPEFIKSLPVDYFSTITENNAIQFTSYSDFISLIQTFSGLSGYSGYSGLSGYSGFSGNFGLSGYSGENNLLGISGLSGYSGSNGFSGYFGYSGNFGISGYFGNSGYSGISGYSGYLGKSGYSGYSGIFSFSGYSGIKFQNYLYNNINLISNTLTSSEILRSYTLTGSSLSINGDFIEIEVSGYATNNGDAKNLALVFDGTTINATSGTLEGFYYLYSKIVRVDNTNQNIYSSGYFGDLNDSFKMYYFANSLATTKTLSSSIDIECESNSSLVGIMNIQRFTIKKSNGISLT